MNLFKKKKPEPEEPEECKHSWQYESPKHRVCALCGRFEYLYPVSCGATVEMHWLPETDFLKWKREADKEKTRLKQEAEHDLLELSKNIQDSL